MDFQVFELVIISEYWGNDPNEFLIQLHCEVSTQDEPCGEAFLVKVVSPEALMGILHPIDDYFSFEFGRGYLIADDYDEKTIKDLLNRFIKSANPQNWDELYQFVGKYFDWL